VLIPNLLVAKGATRGIYLHPKSATKLLKIALRPCWYQEAIREASEFFRVCALGLPLHKYLQTIHGMTPTTLGFALVVDKVVDYDGSISAPLRWYLENGLPQCYRDALYHDIDKLIQAFDDSDAIFQDAHSRNILLQLSSPNTFSLVVIDGFVGRGNWKEAFRRRSSWLRRSKNQHSKRKLLDALTKFGVPSEERSYDFGRRSSANPNLHQS
jgi:hypothetical protein